MTGPFTRETIGNWVSDFLSGDRARTFRGEVVEWAQEVERLGAGEILLTSKDADGTEAGYDIPMTRAVAEAVKVPVTASGGCGSLDDLVKAVKEGKAAAVLAASVFHFGQFTVRQAKEHLKKNGIPVNL